MTQYEIKPLDANTWDAFARLVERHNGVFGGCWWTWFHTFHGEKTFTAEDNRALKERLVKDGRAHAALVFDGEEAVAWASTAPPMNCRTSSTARSTRPPRGARLPGHVDLRGQEVPEKGVTATALGGAIDLIARAGGGVVEGYPHDTDGRKVSVLYNGTRSLYEQAGFDYIRPKGNRNCVMRRVVP